MSVKKFKRDASKAKRKKIGLVVISIVALVLIGIFAYSFIKLNSFYNSIKTTNTPSLTPQPTKIPDQTAFNVLLMGYGGPGHDGAYLTDSIMVLHLDTKEDKAMLISLPRDTFVQVPLKNDELMNAKINAVYQMGLFPNNYPAIPEEFQGEQGSANLLKHVIEDVTGLPIDYYLSINFAGFEKAVDVLGGIEINVETAFDDYEYPIEGSEDALCDATEEQLPELMLTVTVSPREAFPCRYEHLSFQAGPQVMDGKTALKYVRSRHSLQDGTDFGRARRQQLFIKAVSDKVFSVSFLPRIIPLMDEMKQYIRTDFSPEFIQKMLKEAPNHKQYTIENVVLTDANYLKSGSDSRWGYILYPREGMFKWEQIATHISQVSEGITPTPSFLQGTPSAELDTGYTQ